MNILVKTACAVVIAVLLITSQKNVDVVHAQPKPHAVSKVSEKALIAPTAEVKPAVQPTQSPDPEQEAKAFIYQKESSNRTDAINTSSGACGIGQAWPCSKLPCTLQDYECQDRYFTGYMQNRYGSWQAAKSFWLSNCGSLQGCWW